MAVPGGSEEIMLDLGIRQQRKVRSRPLRSAVFAFPRTPRSLVGDPLLHMNRWLWTDLLSEWLVDFHNQPGRLRTRVPFVLREVGISFFSIIHWRLWPVLQLDTFSMVTLRILEGRFDSQCVPLEIGLGQRGRHPIFSRLRRWRTSSRPARRSSNCYRGEGRSG